jgi:hypothetical protein
MIGLYSRRKTNRFYKHPAQQTSAVGSRGSILIDMDDDVDGPTGPVLHFVQSLFDLLGGTAMLLQFHLQARGIQELSGRLSFRATR